jgi:hypothetical protein
MGTQTTFTRRQLRVLFLVIAVLFLAITACSVETSPAQKTPNETEIAKSVEETLAAEQATTGQPAPTEDTGVQQTVQAQQATLEAQTTLISQQATIDAQSTLLAQPNATTEAPMDTAIPTSPSSSSDKPIPLTGWTTTSSMRQAPGCGEDSSGPPCWFGREKELIMTLKEPVLIDSSWANPYLILSQHYVFIQNATIFVQDEGSWKVLWSFPKGQSSSWQPVQIDLSKYKGKEIVIQFNVSGSSGQMYTSGSRNEWYIRDPQINPNFSPY